MVIDFHTHIFPDKIAERSIQALQDVSKIHAFTNGTLDGLKSSMKENNIDISVVLPVVTRPAQFDTITSFAAQVTSEEGIISFGGIHPDNEDYREKLDKIKERGLPGIKLHPDYQDTFIDDSRMVAIIQYASEIGLIVIIHAGLDIGLPDPIHCTPKRSANMLSQIENENAKIVFAHLGGYQNWDEVEEYLVGKNVWLDTSYVLGKVSDEQFLRIVKEHGADRILFATDSPWDGQKEALEHIRKMDLTEEEMERILYRNAVELLGLKL
jgi:predicted TIM-barrel fold metal-dependent hydrolase